MDGRAGQYLHAEPYGYPLMSQQGRACRAFSSKGHPKNLTVASLRDLREWVEPRRRP
jgi:hypothetical protein